MDVSPVYAPSSAKWMFCAPTATLEPLAASITVGSRTGEGNSTISSRWWPATSGRKASTKALACAGVLYIFQLAAIRALRDMFFVGILISILGHTPSLPGDGGHTG